jgi:hypothetical protein
MPPQEKSLSPSIKIKKKKERPIPLNQTHSTKTTKPPQDSVSANTSFTLECPKKCEVGTAVILENTQGGQKSY